MSFLHNITGTVKSAFRIGIGGPSIRQGADHPSTLPESSNGDLYARHNGQFYKKRGGVWVELAEKTVRREVSGSSYNVSLSDSYIGVNHAGPVDLYLPPGEDSKTFTIKDESGAVMANGVVTVHANSGEFIDGSTTYEIGVNFMSVTLIFGNGKWFVI